MRCATGRVAAAHRRLTMRTGAHTPEKLPSGRAPTARRQRELAASAPRAEAAPLADAAPRAEATSLAARAWRAVLRIPLLGKLTGAHLAIALATFAIAVVALPRDTYESTVLLIIGGALLVSVASNIAIVWLALRPLADIEATASRIWNGDVSARVPHSLLADRDLERVGEALNVLLDGLVADQKRIRELAAGVVRVADEERAQIARQLHETCAQSLAALQMELSVVARAAVDRSVAERIERLRRIAGAVLDEVRMLSQAVHPRVMDDLGLGAALQRLARDAERSGTLRVELEVDAAVRDLEPSVASVLYRVAQEALSNAVRHAGAGTLRVRAGLSGEYARVEVGDDGVGFYPDDTGRQSSGEGLSNMRARLALLDGTLEVESALGRGTRVRARVPRLAKTRSVVPGK